MHTRMRYVSLDLETLGTDPDNCDVIEIGAVIDQIIDGEPACPIEELPVYHAYIPKDNYRGQPFAMAMHSKILHRIAIREKGYSYIPPDLLGENFAQWLGSNGLMGSEINELIVAGKNLAGFDARFLRRVPNFNQWVNFHRRVIDPAPLYFDPKIDQKLPNLDECLRRAGITKKVQHNAVDDALDVIRCLRYKWFPNTNNE